MNDDEIKKAVQRRAQQNHDYREQLVAAVYSGGAAALESLVKQALEWIGYKAGQVAQATINRIADWIKKNW